MLSLVSTWMGDRLGTLGAVGHELFFLLLVLVPFWICNFKDPQSRQSCQESSRSSESSKSSISSKLEPALLLWCAKATQTVSHPSLHSKVQWAIINVQKNWIFWTASRSGCETLSHHRGLKDLLYFKIWRALAILIRVHAQEVWDKSDKD